MKHRRFWIFLFGFICFGVVYLLLDVIMSKWFNDPIESWKSISIAGISALGLMYEGFKLNPNFQLSDSWSRQERVLKLQLPTNAYPILEAALSKMGYRNFVRKGDRLYFSYTKNWRQGTLHISLEPKEGHIHLQANSKSPLQLINMGYSSTHLHSIENVLRELPTLLR